MLRPFHSLRSARLAASDGEIGHVQDFYFDDEHWTVRYLVVNTGSWLFEREVLVAPQTVGEVDLERGTIAVHLTREQVRESPSVDVDKPVSRQQEEELHRYYGWSPYWSPVDEGAGMMLPPVALVPPPAFAPPPVVSEDTEPNLASEERRADPHLRSGAELLSGYTIHAEDGEIGRVDDVILDDQGWRVRYFVIHTGPWFLGKDVLLPPEWIERISYDRTEVSVKLPRSAIKDAPSFRRGAPLSREDEQKLYDHYGRKGYWDAAAG
jgi:uncharacterized protein YrrD